MFLFLGERQLGNTQLSNSQTTVGYTYTSWTNIGLDINAQTSVVGNWLTGVVVEGALLLVNIECPFVCSTVVGGAMTLADMITLDPQTGIKEVYFDQTPFDLDIPRIDVETGEWIQSGKWDWEGSR